MYDDPINMKFDVAAFRAEAKISSLTTTIINKFGDLLCAKIDAGTKRACRINAGGVCLCRAIAVEALRAVAPAQADQSDAGRDAVIEEWNKLAHDFVCHAVNSWQWLSNAHTGIAKPGAADVISVHNDLHSLMDRWVELRQRGTPFDRALASAPSETVGRGEDERKLVEDFRALMKRCEWDASGSYDSKCNYINYFWNMTNSAVLLKMLERL